MAIKPIYLLADSQLLFWKENDRLFMERVKEDLDSPEPKAAYLGASNGDQPEYYDLFEAAMEQIGLSNRRMIPWSPSDEDTAFLKEADLILLAGGDVNRGWRTFQQNGVKDVLTNRRFDGVVMIGVSAGAVQLGMGAVLEPPSNGRADGKQDGGAGESVEEIVGEIKDKFETFRFAPFYVGAHDEANEWQGLRRLVAGSTEETRGIGISSGGGAIYSSDGTLEPIRKPLAQFLKEADRVSESLLIPE